MNTSGDIVNNNNSGDDNNIKSPSLSSLSSSIPVSPIVKESKVLKWGGKLRAGWQGRRLVLRPLELSYYKINKPGQVCRAIDIREDTVIKKRIDKHIYAFEVLTPGFRSFVVQAETKDDYDSWMEALSNAKRNAPAHPIRVMIVGDDEEPTHGKARMLTKLVESLAGEEMAKIIIPMRYYLPTPTGNEKGLLASLFSNPTPSNVVKAGRDSISAIFSKNSDSSLPRNTVAANGRRTIDVLIPLEEGGKSAVKVVLWCAPSGDAFAKERAISFVAADVILFVFSVSEITTFEGIEEKWIPEAYRCALESRPKDTIGNNNNNNENQGPSLPPFFLIGTRKMGEMVAVSEANAKDICKRHGIQSYGECRLEEYESVESTFKTMVRSVVEARKMEGLPILDTPSLKDENKKPPASPKISRRPSKGLMSMVGAFSRSFARRGSKSPPSVLLLPPLNVSQINGEKESSSSNGLIIQTKSSESIKTENMAESNKSRGSSLDFGDSSQGFENSSETLDDVGLSSPLSTNKKKSALVSFVSSISAATSSVANTISHGKNLGVSSPPHSNSNITTKSRTESGGNEDDDADSDGGGSMIGPESDEELDDVNPLLNAIDFSPLNAWTDDTSYRHHRRTVGMSHDALTFSLKKILGEKAKKEGTPNNNVLSDEQPKQSAQLISMRSQKGFLTAIDEKPTEEQKELTDLHQLQEQKHKEIATVRNMLEKMHQESSFKTRLKTAHEELMMVRTKLE